MEQLKVSEESSGSPPECSKTATVRNQKEFAVERILSKRIDKNGKISYRVKWEGWANAHNTWEPLKNLANSRALIQEFEEEERKKKMVAPDVGSRPNPDSSFGHIFRATWLSSEIPETILGSSHLNNIHYLLVKLKNTEKPDEDPTEGVNVGNTVVVREEYFREVFPEVIIKYYEKNFRFLPSNKEKEGNETSGKEKKGKGKKGNETKGKETKVNEKKGNETKGKEKKANQTRGKKKAANTSSAEGQPATVTQEMPMEFSDLPLHSLSLATPVEQLATPIVLTESPIVSPIELPAPPTSQVESAVRPLKEPKFVNKFRLPSLEM